MNDKGSTQTLPLIILILGAFAISGCSQADSIPTHSPVAPTSTIEPKPTLEVLTATGLTPTFETPPTPEVLTATGLASTIEPTPTPEMLTATGSTPQRNVDRYGIPAEIVPFAYAVPDGMIKDPAEIQAMIEAKITHLEEINRRFWGDAPGDSEQRQAFYEENIEAIGNAESYGEYAYVITNMGYVLQEAHTFTLPGKVVAARDQCRVYAPKTRYVPWFEPSGHDSLLGGCYAVTYEDELVFYQVQ